jgi:lipopolysaccharide export LptBFGC system permease protein LptF
MNGTRTETESNVSPFEALMIICFGTAWPFSIFKSYHSRRTTGKSGIFLYIVLIGYVAGVIHKVKHDLDPVIWLYVMNSLLVATDIALFHRNACIERRALRQDPPS